MKPIRPIALTLLVAVTCAAFATASSAATPAAAGAAKKAKGSMTTKTSTDAPFWTGHPGPDAFRTMEEQRLGRAKALIAKISLVKGPRTVDNTLRVYDNALVELDMAASQASLMENVHPDSTIRTVAEKLSQEASALSTELSLDRKVYDALSAIPTAGLDAETKYYLEKTLRDFRLSGVDKD